jgi:hypothetical protein
MQHSYIRREREGLVCKISLPARVVQSNNYWEKNIPKEYEREYEGGGPCAKLACVKVGSRVLQVVEVVAAKVGEGDNMAEMADSSNNERKG